MIADCPRNEKRNSKLGGRSWDFELGFSSFDFRISVFRVSIFEFRFSSFDFRFSNFDFRSSSFGLFPSMMGSGQRAQYGRRQGRSEFGIETNPLLDFRACLGWQSLLTGG